MKQKQQLLERERRFVEAFMGPAAGNATKAAIAAGYSVATARQQGSRLLTKANIRRAIDERGNRDPLVWGRIERQAFWTNVANGAAEYRDAPLRDRLKASELLARSQGDFLERRLVSDGPTLADILEEVAQIERGTLTVVTGVPQSGAREARSTGDVTPVSRPTAQLPPAAALAAPAPVPMDDGMVAAPYNPNVRLRRPEALLPSAPRRAQTDFDPYDPDR